MDYQKFPELLPKESTLATEFIQKYPNYDGRNVIVAVFDTGVDPGIAALQETSNGKRKIIDCIDSTGSGDVAMSSEVVAENGHIIGLSKRKLKLGNFINPSGKYRLGIKRAFDLFPRGLEERIKKERAEEAEKRNLEILEGLEKDVQEFKQNNKGELDELKKDELKEKEARVTQFKLLGKKREDQGPIFDVISWFDGKDWRVVIDTNEKGDLSDSEPMTDYRKEFQYAAFSDRDCMNYCVNIYDDGKIVSIVCNAGSHGSHVAGMVGAYYPESPELNGVAPGCQIVSVKIGDSRIGSQETGTGLVRGLLAALNNKCDIINLSYGEDCHIPNSGRFIKLLNEIVHKHGIIFISSAGNNGPALTTVGAPGGISSASIGVGASVTPEMMETQYSMREKLPSNQYTWSSRGPTCDGSLGVSVTAPGGAITTVPNWTLQKSQLMNGTSMSSPNCSGCVALVLSGLKDNKINYNPYTIKRALENTAKKINGVEIFDQGYGMVQVTPAFEYVKNYYSDEKLNVRYEVSLESNSHRGIYIRDFPNTDTVVTKTVFVEPIFHESTSNKDKINYEKRVTLRSTAKWVEVPATFYMLNQKKAFSVKIDPTGLERGKVYYAEIQGIDESQPNAGSLFKCSITVIRPDQIQEKLYPVCDGENFSAGKIFRRFVTVPEGATHAVWNFKSTSDNKIGRLFLLHAVQLRPQVGYSYTEFQKYSRFIGNFEEKNTFEVTGGLTCEFTISQFWSNLCESTVSSEVEFFSLTSSSNPTVHDGNNRVHKLEVRSPVKFSSIKPSISLKTLYVSKKPTKISMRQMPDNYRDKLWNGKSIHELILTYEFSVAESTKVALSVSGLNEYLYDSPLESQFWMIFNASTKEYKGCGDALGRYKVDLTEGSYVALLQLRTDDVDTLEKFKQYPANIEFVLPKEVVLDIYYDRVSGFLAGGSGKFNNKALQPRKYVPLFVSTPLDSVLPKQAVAGATLSGFLLWNKDLNADLKVPYSFTVSSSFVSTVVTPSSPSTPPLNTSAFTSPTMNEEEQFNHSLLLNVISQLDNFLKKKNFDAFDKFSKVQPFFGEGSKGSSFIPFLRLCLDAEESRPNKSEQSIINAANAIINSIDSQKIAIYYGTKHESVDLKIQEERVQLINALYKKALSESVLVGEQKLENTVLSSTLSELSKWVESSDPKLIKFNLTLNQNKKLYAVALSELNKILADTKLSALDKKPYLEIQLSLFEKLGWTFFEEELSKNLLIKYPLDFPLF